MGSYASSHPGTGRYRPTAKRGVPAKQPYGHASTFRPDVFPVEGIAIVPADQDGYPETLVMNKAEKGCIQGVYGERLGQSTNLVQGDDVWKGKGLKERGQRADTIGR